MSDNPCGHDTRFGLIGLPKEANGCLACHVEQLAAEVATLKARLAEAEREQDDMHRVRLLLYDERDALRARLAEVEAELAFARSSGDESAIEYRALRERLAEAEKWRDYYRAKWLGDRAVPQPEPPDSAASQPTDALEKFARDLAAAQTPLDPTAAKVLRENLHDLYIDGGTADNGSQQSVIHVCRTGCIDDNPHQWDGPEWVSEDGCANSATCSRCGMTAMHHSLMTAE